MNNNNDNINNDNEEFVIDDITIEEDYTTNQFTNENEKSIDKKRMKKANEIVSKIIKSRMENERPDDAKIINDIEDDDIIIIKGTYDKVEDIFDIARIPYKIVNPNSLEQIDLSPEQILIINCPGQLSDRSIVNVRNFVESGGYLFTTDWALLNVLEKAFPDYVKYNNKPTKDDVVEIQIVDKDNPFLEMVMPDNADPNWWLEGSSYPIQILNKDKVHVLLQSREMKEKYGESPIAIYFEYGKGKVFHITSHFYLQRAETRTNRHKMSSKDYFEKELNLDENIYKPLENEMEDVNISEVQSTYAMQQFINNIIVDRKKSQKKYKK